MGELMMNEIKVYDKDSKTEVTITEDFQMKAIANRNTILSNAGIVVNAIYEMSKGLKECRDEKLYLAFNCSSFKEYCENELRIGRTQAYKYISFIEKLGEETLKENAHLGVNRLVQLTKEMEEEVKRDSKLKEHEEAIKHKLCIMGEAFAGMIKAYQSAGVLKKDASEDERIEIILNNLVEIPYVDKEIIMLALDKYHTQKS